MSEDLNKTPGATGTIPLAQNQASKPTETKGTPFSSIDAAKGRVARLANKLLRESATWEGAHKERRERKLAEAPAERRNLYKRAWAGNRRAAIRAFCLECVCWSSKKVELCVSVACPLYEFRLRG